LKRKFDKAIFYWVLGGLILTILHGRYLHNIELTPDSKEYHILAVNIMLGKGYYTEPVNSINDYDNLTIQNFSLNTINKDCIPGVNRTPGYPLFLIFIYSLHGINPDAVLPYQIALTFCIGALIVYTGTKLWRKPGIIAGIVAVFLLGMNREAAYPAAQLLSECLATFLLTASAAVATWAKRGSSNRELLTGVFFALAILTRPALVFVGLAYGVILIIQSIRSYSSIRRVIIFACPCIVLLSSWSMFASIYAGKFVPLSDIGIYNLISGLDPIGAAKNDGIPPPKLDAVSLEQFWMGPPHSKKCSLWQVLTDIPKRWEEVFMLSILKFRVGTLGLSRSLWDCILIGFTLISSVIIYDVKRNNKSKKNIQFLVIPSGLIRSQKCIEIFYLVVAIFILLVVLGLSATIIQLFFLVLPVIGLLFRIKIIPKDIREKSGKMFYPLWLSSWYWGYILMTLMTFGLRRFMRPFLPIFYLCAVVAIPLLLMFLLGTRNGSIKKNRHVSIAFNWINRS